MTIPIVQMTQISNMKVIGLTVDFLKIVKLQQLSIEFYGEWHGEFIYIERREVVASSERVPTLTSTSLCLSMCQISCT